LIARAAAVVLASFLLSAGLPPGGQRDPKAPTPQTLECLRGYRAAIDDYRAKRTDAAIVALNSLDHEELTLIVRWLEAVHLAQSRPSRQTDTLFAWDRQALLAAGMLHVDTALQHADDFTFHALLAADLLSLAEAPTFSNAPGSAERRSVLAIGLLLISGRSPQSYPYLVEAVRRFPDDAPLLTALGMLNETQGAATLVQPTASLSLNTIARARGRRNDYLHDAAGLFERALALNPALVEARVRLARVKTLQRDDNAAVPLLQQALSAQPTPQWRYLALLLLGGIRERAGHADEAIRLYEQAIDTWPDGQSAYFAMSHASYIAGDRESAGRTLDRLFARARTPSTGEPWVDYQIGDWIEAQQLLQALRTEAQR
jgi:tetratricopeptide (TPR) repeat protein